MGLLGDLFDTGENAVDSALDTTGGVVSSAYANLFKPAASAAYENVVKPVAETVAPPVYKYGLQEGVGAALNRFGNPKVAAIDQVIQELLGNAPETGPGSKGHPIGGGSLKDILSTILYDVRSNDNPERTRVGDVVSKMPIYESLPLQFLTTPGVGTGIASAGVRGLTESLPEDAPMAVRLAAAAKAAAMEGYKASGIPDLAKPFTIPYNLVTGRSGAIQNRFQLLDMSKAALAALQNGPSEITGVMTAQDRVAAGVHLQTIVDGLTSAIETDRSPEGIAARLKVMLLRPDLKIPAGDTTAFADQLFAEATKLRGVTGVHDMSAADILSAERHYWDNGGAVAYTGTRSLSQHVLDARAAAIEDAAASAKAEATQNPIQKALGTILHWVNPTEGQIDPAQRVHNAVANAIQGARNDIGMLQDDTNLRQAQAFSTDPMSGVVRGIEAAADGTAPTIHNIYTQPLKFQEQLTPLQRAAVRAYQDAQLGIAGWANRVVAGIDDPKVVDVLTKRLKNVIEFTMGPNGPEYLHQMAILEHPANMDMTSTNILQRVAARLQLPTPLGTLSVPGVGRLKGQSADSFWGKLVSNFYNSDVYLPKGVNSVPTGPRGAIGATQAFERAKVVLPGEDPTRAIMSTNVGDMLAAQMGEIHKVMTDEAITKPVLAKFGTSSAKLVSNQLKINKQVLTESRDIGSKALLALRAVARGEVSEKTPDYLRSLADKDKLPDSVAAALRDMADAVQTHLHAEVSWTRGAETLSNRAAAASGPMIEAGFKSKLAALKYNPEEAQPAKLIDKGKGLGEAAADFSGAGESSLPTLYHATSHDNVESIIEQGVRAQRDWDKPEQSVAHFTNIKPEAGSHYVVVRPDPNDPKWIKLGDSSSYGQHWIHIGDVPPEQITNGVVSDYKTGATTELAGHAPQLQIRNNLSQAADIAEANMQATAKSYIDFLQQHMDVTKDELNSARNAIKAALKGGTAFDMRQVSTPGLQGPWYDKQMAAYIDAAYKGDRDGFLRGLTQAQGALQSVTAGQSFHDLFMQSFATAASNPVGWLKSAMIGMIGMANPNVYAKYMASLATKYDDKSGLSLLEMMQKGGLHIGGVEAYSPAEIGKGLGMADPGVFGKVAGVVSRMPLNRAFTMQRNAASVELFRAQVALESSLGTQMTDDALKSIGHQVNLATGYVSSIGMGDKQNMAERLVGRFGVQWFRSQTERLVLATQTGGLDNSVARRILVQQMAAMTGMYVAAAAAVNQTPHFDPTSKDFLTIQLGNSRVGFGGVYKSMMAALSKTVVATANGDIGALTDIRNGKNPLLNYYKSGAPMVGKMLADAVGVDSKTSYGTGPLGELDPQKWAPIDVQAGLNSQGTLLQRALAAAPAAFGLRDTPLTTTDIFTEVADQYAKDHGAASWADMPSAVQKAALVDPSNTELAKAAADRDQWFDEHSQGTPLDAAMSANDRSVQAEGDVLTGLAGQVSSGAMTLSQFRQAYNTWAANHAYFTGQIFGALPPDEAAKLKSNDQTGTRQDILGAQYEAIQPVDTTGTGTPSESDWATWNAARDAFWVDNPEANTFRQYITVDYPLRKWAPYPQVQALLTQLKGAQAQNTQYLGLPKYLGMSTPEGEFVDGVLSAKNQAVQEITQMAIQQGADPNKVKVPSQLAWQYALQQLQAAGLTVNGRQSQLIQAAVVMDGASQLDRLKLINPARLQFIQQNKSFLGWYPGAAAETGLPTKILEALGVLSAAPGASVATKAADLVQSQ